jgi:hypothetical protein
VSKKVEIVGQKIKNVRPMTLAEMNREAWDRNATVIELENGVILYPSRDNEGNGAGILFGIDKDYHFAL